MEPSSLERYRRQIGLPMLGVEGQQRLSRSCVVVVGAGGLGAPVLYALAGAGVGHLRIVDGDRVSESNLNRQFLYTPADIGRKKAEVAAQRLRAYAPELDIQACCTMVDAATGPELLEGADLVVSAVDSIPARRMLSRLCHDVSVPMVNGGVNGVSGLVMAVEFGRTPCLECFYADGPVPPAGGPVLGTISMALGGLMGQLSLQLLLDSNPIPGQLLLLDGSTMTMELVPLERSRRCPVCGDGGEQT